MERNIKFRAWDNINKKWELGYQYPRLGGFAMKGEVMMFGEYSKVLNSFPIQKWHELIITEYSGLQDSKGNEIYEGDLLMYVSTSLSSMEVKFQNGCFVGEGPFNTLPLKDYFEADDFQSIEVTGNIYEQ
jgi:hypothetical protein